MKTRTWKPYLLWTVLAEAVGALSGWLTREGMRLFKTEALKPPLTPPGFVFPVVWALLFALMGAGAARVYLTPPSRERRRSLALFAVQLALNFFWSILFFNLRRYGLAFFWLTALWGLILWMTLSFRRVDSPAGWMQLPYLLWTAFAAYLNLGVWVLN